FNPTWNLMSMSFDYCIVFLFNFVSFVLVLYSRTLCNGDPERSIKLDCYDCRTNGNHKLIGSSYTSLSRLMKALQENRYELINPKKQSSKNYKNSGHIGKWL